MGSPAVADTNTNTVVRRGSTDLVSGSFYNSGETLKVSIIKYNDQIGAVAFTNYYCYLFHRFF